MNTDLVILTFNTYTGADTMMQTLQNLQNDNFIEIFDAVVVTKDSTGNVQVRQPLEIGPGKGTAFGALTGTIIGLLGGPGGALVGLVSGAVTGGATAALMESGLPQDDIKSMAIDELRAGESALAVYLDEIWIDQLEDAARDLDAAFAHHMIREERKIVWDKRAELRKEKIDAVYKDWLTRVDNLRASAEALRQKATSGLQADQATVQERLKSANVSLYTTYQNMLQTLRAWQNQIDANIETFEADAKAAGAEAKATIERRIASDQEARAAVRAHVKDTLTARQNSLKADIEHLKVQAARSEGQMKAEISQRVVKLQADWDAEQKRIDQAAELRKEKIDAAYKDWQTKVDNLRASAETLRQKATSGLQADQASIREKLNNINAALYTTYQNMLQALRAWQQQIDADIDVFKADAKAASADAKTEIERRIASDQESRAAVRAHVKDTLTARQNSLKADIEHLKVQAAQAEGQMKAEISQRVAKLQADWDAEQKRIDQFDQAESAIFGQLVKSFDEAFATYSSAVHEAETKSEKHAETTTTGSDR